MVLKLIEGEEWYKGQLFGRHVGSVIIMAAHKLDPTTGPINMLNACSYGSYLWNENNLG